MALSDFITQFSDLHTKANKGTLLPDEKARYDKDREELAQTLLNAQKITLKPGEQARRALRVARALSIELTVDGVTAKALTFELSAMGFSAMVGGNTSKWQGPVEFKLRLPGAVEVKGEATLVSTPSRMQASRMGFEFTKISDEDRDAIGMTVFDDVLEKLKKNAGMSAKK